MGGKLSKPDPDRFDRPSVVNVSFPRTGTNSMALALERLLDGPVAHGGTYITQPLGDDRLCRLWSQALIAKQRGDRQAALKALREGTRGFAGFSDTPAGFLVPEFVELYPDIKVILVERDPVKWAKSAGDAQKASAPWYMRLIVAIGPGIRWFPIHYDYLMNLCDSYLRDAGIEPGCGWAPKTLELHNQHVINVVTKERLLIMKMKDGWEPLCKFLGKPIPDEPFPWVNDSEAASNTASRIVLKLGLMWLGLFTGISLTAYGGMKLLRL